MRLPTGRPATLLWLALVVLLFCVPLFVGLGRKDLHSDEAIYSYAAEAIVENGDWLNPRSSPNPDAIFLEKPPLKFWIVAAPIRLGILPSDEFGLRFWDAVFGSVAFLYVFAIGRRMAGPLCGVVALVVLFSFERLLFEHGLRSNNMEAALVAAYCGAVFHFLRWSDSEDRRSGARHALAVGLFFFLGFMTKFVAMLFFPIVAGAATFAFAPLRARLRRDWRAWLGVAALVAALVAPWFVYQTIRSGRLVWDVMFGAHVFRRFTANLDPSHLQPWTYYWLDIYRQTEPTGAFHVAAAGGLLLVLRAVKRRWPDGAIVALWFLVPLSLISFGTSKLGHYAYPFLPPFALAAGYLPAWVLRASRAPVDAALRRVDERVAAVTRLKPLRGAFVVIGGVCLALAAFTVVYGGFRVEIAGIRLFSTRSILRPVAGAAVFGLLAARGQFVARFLVPAVLLALAPITAYRATLPRLLVEDHVLRLSRDCLARIDDAAAAAQRPSPRLVAAVPNYFLHQYFFYFRDVGWQWADDVSDDDLRSVVADPSSARPVLIERERYLAFMRRRLPPPHEPGMSPPLAWLEQTPAVQDWLTRAPHRTEIGDHVILVLPGRYGVCAQK